MASLKIKVNDVFEATQSNVVYTIKEIWYDHDKVQIRWDCTGRSVWYHIVNIESIKEWIAEGRLKKREDEIVSFINIENLPHG